MPMKELSMESKRVLLSTPTVGCQWQGANISQALIVAGRQAAALHAAQPCSARQNESDTLLGPDLHNISCAHTTKAQA